MLSLRLCYGEHRPRDSRRMSMVAFDTHAAVRELRAGGFNEDQAERLVDVFNRAVGAPVTKADLEPLATRRELELLATKKDLELLATNRELEPLATRKDLEPLATKRELELLATKTELLATKTELLATIEPLATKSELEFLATKSELAALEARLAWRLVGAGVAVAGIQAAAIVGLLRLVLTP
ncbi:MAG: hypothetical protein OXH69_10850 [Acidobacteria bacterium]|nr:hypothetical protein [Acidobacteriota bacterium]